VDARRECRVTLELAPIYPRVDVVWAVVGLGEASLFERKGELLGLDAHPDVRLRETAQAAGEVRVQVADGGESTRSAGVRPTLSSADRNGSAPTPQGCSSEV
jgi:hypothetical protein